MKKILLPALLLLATSAHAAEPYLGFGMSSVKVGSFDGLEMASLFNDGSFSSATVDNSDNTLKLFGGARINRHLAIEATYADLGELKGHAVSAGGGFYASGNVDYEAEGTAIILDAKGIAPVTDNFAFFGKLGFAHWSVDDELANNGTLVASGSEDGTHPHLAIGTALSVGGGLTLQLEIERYVRVADYNVDALAASLVYTFK